MRDDHQTPGTSIGINGVGPDIIAALIEKSRVQAAQARLPYHQDVAKIQLDDITVAPAGDG